MKKAVGYLMCDKEFSETNKELHQLVVEGFEKICQAKKIKLVGTYVDFTIDGESIAIGAKDMWADIRSKKHGKTDYMIEFIGGVYRIMGRKEIEIIPIEIVYSGLPIKGNSISYLQLQKELKNSIM